MLELELVEKTSESEGRRWVKLTSTFPFLLPLQDPSKKLLHSNEAFSHYISSLLLLNRNLDLTKAVRIRDDLLLASPLPTNASTSSFNATTSSASATSPSSSSDASTLLSGTASAAGAPIHVIVDNAEIGKAEGGGWKAWPIFWRTIGGTLKFLGESRTQLKLLEPIINTDKVVFICAAFATVAVLVMEQAGTLKLGPTANEFTAGQDGGKVVKFADVRGVEEAKEVSLQHFCQSQLIQTDADPSVFVFLRSFKRSSSSVRPSPSSLRFSKSSQPFLTFSSLVFLNSQGS